MSESKIGKFLTIEHIRNISLGKLGDKHHLYGKRRDLKVVEKIREKLKNHPSLKKKWSQERKELLSKRFSKGVIVTDLNNKEIVQYSSRSIAMKELKIGHNKLINLLNGELLNNKYKVKNI